MPCDSLNTTLSLGEGSIELRNRIVMASLTRSRAVPVDVPNEINEDYYVQRAKGGVGLILSEGTLVSPQGTEWPNIASIYSDEHADGWKKVVEAVHAEGTPIFAQLWHVGRVAHPDMPLQKGIPVACPSPIRARGGKFRMLNDAPNATPVHGHPDPWQLVDEFRRGAKLAKAAGFDGVELHSANGYLVAQFLDKNTNQRDDEWGGSLEGRLKFFKECLSALLEIYPANRVGIKINPCGGYNDIGMNEEDTRETFTAVIKHAVDAGLAYIQLVRYLPFMDGEYDGKMRAETHLDVLEVFGPLIKNAESKTKLFMNGDYSPEDGDKLVEEGKADAIVYGRPWINNPDFANRVFKGQKMNEDLGHPLNPPTFYAFAKDPREGYTDYPSYEEAQRKAN